MQTKTTNRMTKALPLALAAALMVAGCEQERSAAPPAPEASTGIAPAAGSTPTIGRRIDDAAITARVKAALLADPAVKGLAVTVETRNGEVQLGGFVPSDAQVERAVDIARHAEGVSGVQNRIEVAPPGTIGSEVDDALVTARVIAALARDDTVRARDVTVRTAHGKVQLSGFVASEAQRERAGRIAGAIEGVASVENSLALEGGRPDTTAPAR